MSVSTPGAEIYGPTTIRLRATAADSDGTVAKVDFFANGNLLGTDTTAPYSFDWVSGAVGTYSVTVTATDDDGAVSSSGPVSITIRALVLSITAPSDGVMLVGDRVVVSGTLDAPFNSGVTVNGVVAGVHGNAFHANVVLPTGQSQISATITTPTGATATQSITVTTDGVAPFLSITPDSLEGLSPFQVVFTVTNPTELDANVVLDGQATFVVPGLSSLPVALTYTGAGLKAVRFDAMNAVGQSMSQEFGLAVLDATSLDQKFATIWNGMNSALIAGDKAGALAYLGQSAQLKYGPVFDVLMGEYADIVSTWSPPLQGELTANLAEYVIVTNHGGSRQVYLIYLARGADGVWRLEEM